MGELSNAAMRPFVCPFVCPMLLVFTARCYASAVLAMALCPSVSVTSRCSIETDERIELVLACEHPSTRPTLC